jgi:tetratricopeptide (TPR) repeat protein
VARALGARPAAAAFAAVLLTSLETFWAEATVARVYTPNLLLLLLAGLALARFRLTGASRRLDVAFLFTGLALAVHTVSVVLAPALLLGLADRRLARRQRARACLWLLPGLAVYLYVPIASSFDPAQNWGDPSTFSNLVRYLSREEYWQRAWVRSSADLARALAHYAAILPRELTWPGLALAGLGAWRLGRTAAWSLVAVLAVIAGTVTLVVSHGSANDIFQWDRYVLPALAALVLLAGVGGEALASRVAAAGSRAWLLPALALAPLALGAPRMDRSRFTLAEAFNRRVLERLPPKSVLIADGDNQLFPLSYLHHVQGQRPDVNLVMQGINVLSSLPIEPATRPVFFTHFFDLGAPQFVLQDEGLVYRLHPTDGTPRPDVRWADWSVPELEDWSGQGTLDFLARSLVGDYQLMKAIHYEARHPLAAQEAVRANLSVAHDNPVNAVNGALLLERLGLLREAGAAYERTLALDARSEVAARHLRELRPRLQAIAPDVVVRDKLAEATARFQAGALDEAVRVLTEAAHTWPASDRLHYNLGALALQAGHYPAALREMLITLDLKPDDAAARRDVAEIDRRLAR